MRRLLTIAAAVAILLLALAPAALAAGPGWLAASSAAWSGTGTVISVDGSVDVPAGDRVDTVVVVRGTATIEGAARTVVVLHGDATLTGATADNVVVVDGTVNLAAGTTVTGGVATLHGDVVRDPSAIVAGRITTLDTSVAALAIALVPFLIVLGVGFLVATVASALGLAAFGARQVRSAEALITREPGPVLLAGLIGAIGLPLLFGIVTLTVIGAPVGLAALLVGLPLLAFAGWLVAAIWIGDWLLARHGTLEPAHPYRAAILGVIVLTVAGLLPLVSAIATLFGAGSILLAAWRGLHPAAPSPAAYVGPDAQTGWAAPATPAA